MTPEEKKDSLQFAEEKLVEMVSSEPDNDSVGPIERLKLQFICIQFTKSPLFRLMLDQFTSAYSAAHLGRDIPSMVTMFDLFQEVVELNKEKCREGADRIEEQFQNWRSSR